MYLYMLVIVHVYTCSFFPKPQVLDRRLQGNHVFCCFFYITGKNTNALYLHKLWAFHLASFPSPKFYGQTFVKSLAEITFIFFMVLT